MKICVLGRTGRGGRHDPHVFHLGTRRHKVVAVLDEWTEGEHRYFKVRVEDGRYFVLRYDRATDAWELAAAYGGGTLPAAVVRI